jgi:hypothetical protein
MPLPIVPEELRRTGDRIQLGEDRGFRDRSGRRPAPYTWRSTSFGERRFCDTCGSLLTIRVDFQPESIDIAAATLDAPDMVPPAFHIFCKDALSRAPIDDGLPRFEEFRPETRGLPRP